MIRAVIFDFNGVLVDDEEVHFELFREVLAEEAVVLSAPQYHERFLGYDDRKCFEAALREAGQEAAPERLDALVARKAARYVRVAEAGLRFFPAAAECLTALAERWPLAINSGALRPEIEFALNRLSCRELVSVIIAAEDTHRCKPHPQGYLQALDALRLLPHPSLAALSAEQCLVVEDSLAGVESAKGAGMRVAGIAHTYTPDELRAAGADVVLPGLTSLTPSWVGRNFASERNLGLHP
jgi:HAD superfamily hydrolase (TIGR01509 family)